MTTRLSRAFLSSVVLSGFLCLSVSTAIAVDPVVATPPAKVTALPVDWSGYVAVLQEKIRREWMLMMSKVSVSTVKQDAVVAMSVNTQGKLTKSVVLKTSGEATYDKACMDAIQNAAPFEKLPANYTKPQVNINFTCSKLVGPNKQQLSMWESYVLDVEKTIKQNWHADHDNKITKAKQINSEAKYELLVGKDGTLLSAKLLTPSGDKKYDASCANVLKSIKAFSPLPKEYPKDTVKINFTFTEAVTKNKQ